MKTHDSPDLGDYESLESIHRLFETQAQCAGRAVAVVGADGVSWSYEQLDEIANRVANTLIRLGTTLEEPVGICAHRSPAAIALMLGVLKAGGAYVPLDPANPPSRLLALERHVRMRIILADKSGAAKLNMSGSDATVVSFDEILGAGSTTPRVRVGGNNLAYIMYTSGSTGEPKAVMVEHRGIVRLVREPNYVQISSDDTFVQLASLFFDAATFEIWGALLNGAKLVVPGDISSLEKLRDVIEKSRATILWLTSGLFNALVDEYPDSLRHVKQLLTGGDIVSPKHARAALQHLQRGRLINGYGPTENTTFTCCHPITVADTYGASIPIGKAISGTSVYLLDEYLRPVEPGEAGQIFIGGRGLARGYWNDPHLTGRKFVTLETAKGRYERLYASGDLGRWNSAGNLEFVGRIDSQVKIRGFRVEPEEVELAVGSHPDVKNVSIVVTGSEADKRVLRCYCVPKTGRVLTQAGLRQFLRSKLPEYMIPAEFVILTQLPLNASGKVDRRALVSEAPTIAAREEPLNNIERELLAIWRELLNVDNISVDDDFFDLGGHSLLAARLLSQINRIFRKQLALSIILQAPTVRKLSTILAGELDSQRSSCVQRLSRSDSETPIFLVHAIGGSAITYKPLASLLADFSVYALQAEDDQAHRAWTVEDLARKYIEEILAIQKVGPYYLGGFSAGGVLVFEMARQLQRMGHSIALLALIDSHITPSPRSLLLQGRISDLLRAVPQVVRWNIYCVQKYGIRQFLKTKASDLLLTGARPSREATIAPFSQFKESFLAALNNYKPAPLSFPVRTVIFLTQDSRQYDPQTVQSWTGLVGSEIEQHSVAGNHSNILHNPYVSTLGAKLQQSLRAAMESVDLLRGAKGLPCREPRELSVCSD